MVIEADWFAEGDDGCQERHRAQNQQQRVRQNLDELRQEANARGEAVWW